MVGASRSEILDKLPFIGLDIESSDGEAVRVEYSPNRPDLGTDIGIARSLKGLLGRETGMPVYVVKPSGISVSVDGRLSSVRPCIGAAAVTGLRLDAEDVRQIMSLQEDLHNGLGRKRRVFAIGLHDLERVAPPLSYMVVGPDCSFVPLGSRAPATVGSILTDTPEGRSYGAIIPGRGKYPIIKDSRGSVLSFPPVINGDATRVTEKTRAVLVEVTGTGQGAVDDALAVATTTLAEAGGRIMSVRVERRGSVRETPDLSPVQLPLDTDLIRRVLGLQLTGQEMVEALERSRLSVRRTTVFAARYRVDLMHRVDLAEEVALGYGIWRIGPLYPPSNQPGSFHPFEQFLDAASTVMAGAGMLEMMTFELVDEGSMYARFGRSGAAKVAVHQPRSLEHSVLRDSLIPSLMTALSENVRSDYPQRIFEIGRVYSRVADGVSESWHLGCLVAHSQTSFSEAKMFLEAVCRTLAGAEISAHEAEHWAFAHGRCASVGISGRMVGHVGELSAEAVDAFGLRVPVAGFEVDLRELRKQLK